ncbi:hypothetical protein BLNAU_20997 [Blattamonas nauphoetae]|uniref:SP-RING-type domain-containing protein n=1 Tax=Blattamonas nauphoetae TaxID=2049346 RepID=A0ABQ9X1A2_9EUKA|nr:hypothetical protein BLNAU_20997 [Blattamonas nauphoetae]
MRRGGGKIPQPRAKTNRREASIRHYATTQPMFPSYRLLLIANDASSCKFVHDLFQYDGFGKIQASFSETGQLKSTSQNISSATPATAFLFSTPTLPTVAVLSIPFPIQQANYAAMFNIIVGMFGTCNRVRMFTSLLSPPFNSTQLPARILVRFSNPSSTLKTQPNLQPGNIISQSQPSQLQYHQSHSSTVIINPQTPPPESPLFEPQKQKRDRPSSLTDSRSRHERKRQDGIEDSHEWSQNESQSYHSISNTDDSDSVGRRRAMSEKQKQNREKRREMRQIKQDLSEFRPLQDNSILHSLVNQDAEGEKRNHQHTTEPADPLLSFDWNSSENLIVPVDLSLLPQNSVNPPRSESPSSSTNTTHHPPQIPSKILLSLFFCDQYFFPNHLSPFGVQRITSFFYKPLSFVPPVSPSQSLLSTSLNRTRLPYCSFPVRPSTNTLDFTLPFPFRSFHRVLLCLVNRGRTEKWKYVEDERKLRQSKRDALERANRQDVVQLPANQKQGSLIIKIPVKSKKRRTESSFPANTFPSLPNQPSDRNRSYASPSNIPPTSTAPKTFFSLLEQVTPSEALSLSAFPLPFSCAIHKKVIVPFKMQNLSRRDSRGEKPKETEMNWEEEFKAIIKDEIRHEQKHNKPSRPLASHASLLPIQPNPPKNSFANFLSNYRSSFLLPFPPFYNPPLSVALSRSGPTDMTRFLIDGELTEKWFDKNGFEVSEEKAERRNRILEEDKAAGRKASEDEVFRSVFPPNRTVSLLYEFRSEFLDHFCFAVVLAEDKIVKETMEQKEEETKMEITSIAPDDEDSLEKEMRLAEEDNRRVKKVLTPKFASLSKRETIEMIAGQIDYSVEKREKELERKKRRRRIDREQYERRREEEMKKGDGQTTNGTQDSPTQTDTIPKSEELQLSMSPLADRPNDQPDEEHHSSQNSPFTSPIPSFSPSSLYVRTNPERTKSPLLNEGDLNVKSKSVPTTPSLNEMTKFGSEVSEASEGMMKEETCEEGEGKADCGENKKDDEEKVEGETKDESRNEDEESRMLVDRPESLTSHSALPPDETATPKPEPNSSTHLLKEQATDTANLTLTPIATSPASRLRDSVSPSLIPPHDSLSLPQLTASRAETTSPTPFILSLSSSSSSSESETESSSSASPPPSPHGSIDLTDQPATKNQFKPSSLSIPLTCPLTTLPFTSSSIPARAVTCSHPTLFSLSSFIAQAKETRDWRCPVCRKIMGGPEQIKIDAVVTELLETGMQNEEDDGDHVGKKEIVKVSFKGKGKGKVRRRKTLRTRGKDGRLDSDDSDETNIQSVDKLTEAERNNPRLFFHIKLVDEDGERVEGEKERERRERRRRKKQRRDEEERRKEQEQLEASARERQQELEYHSQLIFQESVSVAEPDLTFDDGMPVSYSPVGRMMASALFASSSTPLSPQLPNVASIVQQSQTRSVETQEMINRREHNVLIEKRKKIMRERVLTRAVEMENEERAKHNSLLSPDPFPLSPSDSPSRKEHTSLHLASVLAAEDPKELFSFVDPFSLQTLKKMHEEGIVKAIDIQFLGPQRVHIEKDGQKEVMVLEESDSDSSSPQQPQQTRKTDTTPSLLKQSTASLATSPSSRTSTSPTLISNSTTVFPASSHLPSLPRLSQPVSSEAIRQVRNFYLGADGAGIPSTAPVKSAPVDSANTIDLLSDSSDAGWMSSSSD